MKAMRALWLIVGSAFALAQTPEPPGLEGLPPSSQQLVRIRNHMAEILTHQPNYTCLETVQRSNRASVQRKLVSDDTIRLEVALVDGKEMFAWPGSRKFEETDLRKLVPTGTFGNGNFALHARSVFMGRTAAFQYRGAEVLSGVAGPVERYDFQVPRALSGYTIRVEEHIGVAGYHGSFFAEKDTLDVRRLEVVADDIPADLGVKAASDRMDYARLRIGTGDFLLPAESLLDMTDSYGIESVNHTRFSDCRQYAGESTLKFDDTDSTTTTTAPVSLPESQMPEGLEFIVALDQDVDLSTAAVGDAVNGHLQADVRRKNEVVAPKGAKVRARITRVDRRENFSILGITVTEIDTASTVLRVEGKLSTVTGIEFLLPPRNTRISTGPPQPGEGLILMRSGRVKLIRGMLMYWRT